MKRSDYRNIMVIMLLLCLGVATYIFFLGQEEEQEIIDRQNTVTRLTQELENAARLSAALTELDQLTINEKTATQLDILRHLGLEQTDINFAIESREVRTIGDTNLYVRTIRLESTLDYPAALYLADRLHNTKKLILSEINLNPSVNKRNKINLMLKGKVYGLDKVDAPR